LNTLMVILWRPYRFTYNKMDNQYHIHDDKFDFIFLISHRAELYLKGLQNRISALTEVYFINLIDFKNGDVVLDVGANVGELSVYFRHLEFDIKYIGIEPSFLEFLCLQKNARGYRVLNFAAWNENLTKDIFLDSEMASSSLIEPPNVTSIQSIEAKRIDSLFADKIKVIKIDAEGAEIEVLEGLVHLLHLVEYISIDLGPERGLSQETTFVACLNFLLQYGFSLENFNHERIIVLFHNTRNHPVLPTLTKGNLLERPSTV